MGQRGYSEANQHHPSSTKTQQELVTTFRNRADGISDLVTRSKNVVLTGTTSGLGKYLHLNFVQLKKQDQNPMFFNN